MCLLVTLSRTHPEASLVVAANRDEWLARPATPIVALQNEGPRILGGRDEVGGGTWLAVNEHGVVAGLTNRPQRSGADSSKHSRGELPLLLAQHPSASDAAKAFCDQVNPDDYNPCWLLVGDATDLYYIDATRSPAQTRALPVGIAVLENRALEARSPKQQWVTAELEAAPSWLGEALITGLAKTLQSHQIPPDAEEDALRPLQTEAACVHAGPYGTRCATLILVSHQQPPGVFWADGPPCRTTFADMSHLWR